METNIEYIVFEGEGFPVDESLLANLRHDYVDLTREMMSSGYYQNGLDVSKFLRDDLTINLDLLALAVTVAVLALESAYPESGTTFLKLINLDKYYEKRGISGSPRRETEERAFLLTFIKREAEEVSNADAVVVKYV